jgi:hypothetical protein
MMSCHRITGGLVEIEKWLPPPLAENIAKDASCLAEVCRIFGEQMAKNAADLARLAGIER